MKPYRSPFRFAVLLLTAYCSLLTATVAQQPKNVTKSTVPATLNQITEDLIFGSGRTLTIASGGTFTYSAGASFGGSASEFRSDIGLAIGTNVQAWDADLDSWALLTRAAGFDTFTVTPSSANLRGLLSDETGTGLAYFQGGALGTPASGTLTNATGLPISSGVSGLGTGVATALGNATNGTGGFVTADGAATLTNKSIAGSQLTGAYTAAGLTMATSRLLGRTTALSGAAEEISVGTGLSLSAGALDRAALSGDVTASAGSNSVTVTKLNGTSLAGLATGLLKNTTTTGVPTIAVAATDYVAPSAYASANGLTMATSRLLGRTTALTGAAEEISVGTGLSLSGGSLVTSAIPNASLSNSAITIAGTSTSLGGSISLDTIDNAIAANGLIARTAANTRAARTITGTSNRLTVTNGDGVAGNPTLDISSSYVGQNTITTTGALTSGSIASGFGSINIGSNALTAGATSVTTLSASGTISANATGVMLQSANGGTSANYLQFQNTGGFSYIGVDNSTGATLASGNAYDLTAYGASGFSAVIAGVNRGRFSSAGLAVTGNITSTSKVGFGRSGVGLNEVLNLDQGAADNFVRFDNTGTFKGLVGIAYTAGSGVSGSASGDGILRTDGTTLHLSQGGTSIARVTSGGLAVTGTLSTTGHAGIGVSTSADVGLYLTPAMTTTNAHYGILNNPSMTAGVNSQAFRGAYLGATLAKGAFTGLDHATVFIDTPTTSGAGTIATTYQLYVAASASATSRFGIRQVGTSDINYFDGNLIIGGNGTVNPGSGFDAVGIGFAASTGKAEFSADGDASVTINRKTSDGSAVIMRRSGTQVGSISVTTTATAYNTSSDVRLKTNIRDIADSGVIIDALRPRLFDWKSGADSDTYGFVAQEVYPIFPQAVTKGDDDPDTITQQWAMDSAKMMPVAIAELKALRARVADLEAQHAAQANAAITTGSALAGLLLAGVSLAMRKAA